MKMTKSNIFMNTEIRSKKKSPRDADYESLMNMVMKFVSGSNGL